MLCSVEIGTTKGYAQAQQHYWVVAKNLDRAMRLALIQVVEDYPDKEDEVENWVVIEATIKSVDDPLIDWERMNITGDAATARTSLS